jgi:ATP-dependent Clp protease ATP-binding subunit ClpC
MTSNIGSQYIQKMETIGFASNDTGNQYSEMKSKVNDALKDFFKPEFLNRLDDILIFDVLSKENIEKIVRLQVGDVANRLMEKDIILNVDDEAIAFIGDKSFDPKFGARPIRRYIQSHILNKVASMIIARTFEKGGRVEVSVKKGELQVESKKKIKNTVSV